MLVVMLGLGAYFAGIVVLCVVVLGGCRGIGAGAVRGALAGVLKGFALRTARVA